MHSQANNEELLHQHWKAGIHSQTPVFCCGAQRRDCMNDISCKSQTLLPRCSSGRYVKRCWKPEPVFRARQSIVTFRIPINLPADATERHDRKDRVASSPPPVSRTFRRTRDKCHRAKSETKRIWNFKMRRRMKCTGGQREGDNNEKGGGVKSYRCSPHPDTAGLRPWGTLIHHYRFTISLSWPPPPTQEQPRGCLPASRRQHKTNKPNNMHTRIDLVPGDQMNLPTVR